VPWLVGAAIAAADAGPGLAQANLDAGKSPAQIFAATCAACHRSPREIRPTGAGFLRDHYSTGAREAAAMAAYLAAVGSDPRAVQQRRPPTLGAGQAAGDGKDNGKSAEGGEGGKHASGRPRRPSDSVEIGRLSLPEGQETGPAQTASTPAAAPPIETFEE
jgi:hypothetical protein